MKTKKLICYILDYWNDILSGKEVVSSKIYRTYRKIVNDLNNPGVWHYSQERADHAINFIENYCRHSQGKMGGKPVILEPWEKAMIATMFGFIDSKGNRKYQRVVWIVGKKNGKSLIASAVGLYLQIADGEIGPEIVSAATTRDQAKKIWSAAKAMVKMSPALRKRIKPLTSELSSYEYNFGSFKPLSSDYNTLDGLNLHGVLLDEIQQWTNGYELYDILARGITAREQPMIFITTTAGTVREDIYDIIYDECKFNIDNYDVENGVIDERSIAFIYELDSKDEWQDPKCWKKANPGLGTIKNLDTLIGEVEKAKRSKVALKKLLCKDFNIRETSSEAWLSPEEYINESTFAPEVMKDSYVMFGTDLSHTTDLTCATIMFKKREDKTIYVEQMYWLPEETLEIREREDHIPYTLWNEQGYLRVSEGSKIHYGDVVAWYKEMCEKHNLIMLWHGYDAYSSTYFIREMEDYYGKEAQEKVYQGVQTLSAPMMSLGADIRAKRINYNNNPITRWCLGNVAVKYDDNLNMKPDKSKNQRARIDGLASMLDAYVVYERHANEYETLI